MSAKRKGRRRGKAPSKRAMAKRSWARFLASLKPPPLWPINHDRWRRVMLALEIAQFYA